MMKDGIIGTDEDREFHCEAIVKLFDRNDVSENLANIVLPVPPGVRRRADGSYRPAGSCRETGI